ncbi:uncharacterized protein LOC124113521 [Haliotis rufescens]|uniref:uncharacterized protein LOC124113521 n=1 Tax=Haliotis rufescens TaxID=6454 RepID=UPI00201EA8B8|nr:uncharacterized protein LOC124113521 [Haliotis rufescens]
MRTSVQTGTARVGSYTNAQSQPSGASSQSSPAGSSTNGTSAPAASNSTATPPARSESYNATRVAALLKALVAPSAPLLPYAVVDPIPYGAARLPGQQAPVELVGPRQQTVPAPANSLTKLGRALLSGYVQSSPPKAKPPVAAPPAYNPSYPTSKGLGANMINTPQQSSLYGPLGSVAVPGNQLNTINPSRLAQLRSLSASQLQQTIMMKLIDVGAKIKAARSLDCKTVASLKGRRGRTSRSMSCDDDTCPVSMSCKTVFHVAFCCPQGVTYRMIQREAQNEITNILYDN